MIQSTTVCYPRLLSARGYILHVRARLPAVWQTAGLASVLFAAPSERHDPRSGFHGETMDGCNLTVSRRLHLVSKNFSPSDGANCTDSPKVHPHSPSPRAPLTHTNEVLAGVVDLILHVQRSRMTFGQSRPHPCGSLRYRGELEVVSETRSGPRGSGPVTCHEQAHSPLRPGRECVANSIAEGSRMVMLPHAASCCLLAIKIADD